MVVDVVDERSDAMPSIWKCNFPLEVRQILGLERETDSFPDDTIVSFHLLIIDGVVWFGFVCRHSSLRQVFLNVMFVDCHQVYY